jgi:Trk-type K+ transport system membrane component
MEIKEEEEKEIIIPFIHRKSVLLSISFRDLYLEMSEYKMKVESLNKKDIKEPLISSISETTMVIKYIYLFILFYLILNRYQNSKLIIKINA